MELAQLRQALGELNGERDVTFAFSGMADACAHLTVAHAMLVPEEGDALVKVTDGQSIYIVDAQRVSWVKIGRGVGGAVKAG